MASIHLRPVTYADTDHIVRWRNSWDVKKSLYSQEDLTAQQHLEWMERNEKTHSSYQFIIVCTMEDGTSLDIGTIFIKNINVRNRKGEFGIFIGEPSAKGKGYAAQATAQILRFAFEQLDLNRVYLSVFSDNLPGIRAYLQAGFLIEGELKQDFLRYDGFADITLMGITRERWDQNESNKSD